MEKQTRTVDQKLKINLEWPYLHFDNHSWHTFSLVPKPPSPLFGGGSGTRLAHLLFVVCQDSPNSSVPNMVLSLAFAVTNPCGSNNGGCQYLCLLNAEASDGYTCACPDDLVAENNGRNCLSKQTVHIYDVRYKMYFSD